MSNLPETVTMTVHLHIDPEDAGNPSPRFAVFNSDMTQFGRIHLSEAEVTFRVPQVDVTSTAIRSLREQQQRIRAEAERKAEEIEDRIQSLLAIEYQPKVPA